MPRKYVFADEAGCMTFAHKPNVSRYFIVCTAAMDDCALASDLIGLRRDLAWKGEELGEYFHATTDKQSVRDAVFETILAKPFTVQATIMEKSKSQPHIRKTQSRFYQFGWFYHFKFGVSKELRPEHDALITAASIGQRKERAAFQAAIDDVMKQTVATRGFKTDFLPAASDPCLQVADYCAWAIQRKWERNCSRSYDLIKNRITYEYDLWKQGTNHHY
jgi:Protein of unknown function (DUF3800)